MKKISFILFIAICLVTVYCKKTTDIQNVTASSSQENLSEERDLCTVFCGDSTILSTCGHTIDCCENIYLWTSIASTWSMYVALSSDDPECEIACYGSALNGCCQIISPGNPGTFPVVSSATYTLVYSGPLPATFAIGNPCVYTIVTFTSGNTSIEIDGSRLDWCDYSGPCI
ncbi:MAG: hypothetical protein R3A50_18650 [Saprospiraceae bacterium]